MRQSETKARPLGPQEALFAELTRRTHGGVQLVCMGAFEQRPDPQDVRSALRAIHRRHPMLQARVEDRTALWWVCDVPFERIGIRMQATTGELDVEAFYAAEAAIPLDVTAASWRAVLLTDADGRVAWIALVSNHGAIDGRSALVVLNDLDVLLNEPAAWSGKVLDLAAAAEEGLAASGLSGDRGLLPAWPAETQWRVDRPAGSAERRPQAFLRVVPQATLDAMHARLGPLGIHLGAAFAAAAARAAEVLPGRTAWTGIVAPTDVRGDCTPPVSGDAVGEYIAGIALILGPEHEAAGLLETARELQEQFLRNRPPSLLMEAQVPMEATRAQVDQMAAPGEAFAGGICVSDIGDASRLSGRRLGFTHLLVMPSQNHGIHAVMVAIVTTSAGVCLSFGYDTPLRARADAHAFAERYLQALDSLAGAA